MSQRPLFDPDRMRVKKDAEAARATPPTAAAAPASAREPQPPLTVSALASLIDGALSKGVPSRLRVIGEVSGFRERTHWYFDLKDAGAVINGVMFQSAARKAGFTPSNGQEVVAAGRVEFYAPGGKVSFIIDTLEPVGAGALELAYRRLCEELRALGWFDPARKRPLPSFPRKIAVVTSRSAAALQDVLVTMKKRCPAVGVIVVDVRVQGEGAAAEIAGAVRYLGAHHARLGLDAVLVTRGGGSMEDLWAFNDRDLARAIVGCPVPVVAAIGHETDTTIAELVADERCATPTQAAMRLTPDSGALMRQLDSTALRLRLVLSRSLGTWRDRVRAAGTRPFLRDPGVLVARERERVQFAARALRGAMAARVAADRSRLDHRMNQLERRSPGGGCAESLARLDGARSRLPAAARSLLHRAGGALESAERGLRAVAPLRVLERGYSITTRADGRAVRAASDVRAGEIVTTRTADGRFESRVLGADIPAPTASAPGGPRGARPRPGASPATDQLGLF